MEQHRELRGTALAFLFLLWFLWFMNIGARAIFSPVLPLVEDEFAVSHARASSVFMFQSLGYGVSLLLSGLYAGRLGYRKSISLSLAAASLAFFLMPFVKTISGFYAIACVLGFAAGSYMPSVLPLITGYFAEMHWGKSISIHDSGSSFSIFCMPFVALFLLRFFQWRGIFAVLGAVLFACAVAFFVASDEMKITRESAWAPADLLKRRALWILGTLWVFAAAALWGVYFMIPLYLTKELHLDIGYANTVLGVSRLGGIAVAIVCGALVDKFSLKRTMFTVLLLTGFLTIAVGVVSARLAGLALSLQVIFVTGFFPLGLVSVARLFDARTRGTATGIILTLSMVVGAGIFPYLLGLSGDLISFRVGFVALGVLVALSSLLLFGLKELR